MHRSVVCNVQVRNLLFRNSDVQLSTKIVEGNNDIIPFREEEERCQEDCFVLMCVCVSALLCAAAHVVLRRHAQLL